MSLLVFLKSGSTNKAKCCRQFVLYQGGWWSGVVVSALALINEVNQHRARLVLRWVTVSTQGQLSRPSLRGR